jgi:hypothetical protein
LPLFSGQADLFSQFCCLSQVVKSASDSLTRLLARNVHVLKQDYLQGAGKQLGRLLFQSEKMLPPWLKLRRT